MKIIKPVLSCLLASLIILSISCRNREKVLLSSSLPASGNMNILKPDHKEEAKISHTPGAATDSLDINRIRARKKEVSDSLGKLALITIEAEDNECVGDDSLYYGRSLNLLAHQSDGGCEAENIRSFSIYDHGNVIYQYAETRGDGLLYKITEVFYRADGPFYGTKTEIKWDWDTRTPTDTTHKDLSGKELELESNTFFSQSDLDNAVKYLPISKRTDNEVLIIDTTYLKISAYHRITMDSAVYNRFLEK